MLTKDVRTAWNLLHLLNDDWQKTVVLALDLSEKYGEVVTEHYLSNIVHRLAQYELLETKRNAGVRRSVKKIIFLDELLVAFDVKMLYNSNTPYGKVMMNVWAQLKRTYLKNDEILHKLDGKK